MATNKPYGDGRRQGAVKKRVQAKNPKIKRYVKISKETNLIMDVRSVPKKKFKGVRDISKDRKK